jgi:hypothetical protein
VTLATALVAMSAGLVVPTAGFAAVGKDPVVEASKTGNAQPNLKLSQDGFNTMRAIRGARLAIFNGDTAAAKKLVDEAGADIAKVKGDEMTMHKASPGNWVPVDGQLVVADNFVATPEKAAKIASGNKKLKEGKTAEAMKDLKLAEVDVGFSRVLMPLDATRRQISIASGLLTAQKFYEANMVLKAAEDGLVLDTVAVAEAPNNTAKTAAAAAPATPSH